MPKQGIRNPETQVVQDGKWELQNLKFVGEFMEVNGLSTTMIAEKLDISRQSVYYWLKKDDAMISNIYNRNSEKLGNISISLSHIHNMYIVKS